MALAATQLSTSGVPGRRYAAIPSVFEAETIVFPARFADVVFPPPWRVPLLTKFCQKGDLGVAIVVQLLNQSDGTPVDLSEATDLSIRIGYPDESTAEFDATIYSDGFDGKIVYVSEDGDLNAVGVCSIQGFASFRGGAAVASQVVQFEVLDNVAEPAP